MGNNLPSEYACWERKIFTGRLPSAYQEVEYILSNSAEIQIPNVTLEYPFTINANFEEPATYDSSAFLYRSIQDSYRFDFYQITSMNNTCRVFNNMASGVISIVKNTKVNFCINATNATTYTATYNGSSTTASTASGTFTSRFRIAGPGYKLYSFYMKLPTITVNLIPCYRKSDSVAGMYDLVNDVFYTNAGTGTFTVGADVVTTYPCYKSLIKTSVLPSEYTELEYIQSSGTQYIDTGFIANQDSRIVCDGIMYFGAANPCISGSRYYTGNTNTRCFLIGDDGGNNNFATIYGASYLTEYDSSISGVRHTYDFNKNLFYLDGTLYRTHTAEQTFTTAYNIYLFGISDNYQASNPPIASGISNTIIYSAKIYDNGTLVRNFIPAKRNSDSAIGMYDTVTQTFFTNSGTGTFTAGAEVYHTYSLYKRLITA